MPTSDLTQAIHEMDQHAPELERAGQYYRGEIPEYFGSIRLRGVLKDAAERYRLNLAKTPVNVVANRLEIAAATVPDNDQITAILQADVWDANELTFEMPNVIRNTCRDGDGYLLVWEGAEDGTVEVSYNSPRGSRMLYDPESPRRKRAYVHTWCDNKIRYADVFYADSLEQYWQPEEMRATDESAWQRRVTAFRDPEPGEEIRPDQIEEVLGQWPLDNPYGEVPGFHFRTDRPWGVPLHKDAYGPQDAITKIIAAHLGTVDYQTFPQRYALEESALNTDDLLRDEDWDDFTGNNATGTASGKPEQGLRAGSGEVWWLKGVKGVGQFEVADPKVFTDPAEFYIRMMAQTTDTPLHFFDPGGDQPSGESRRTAEGTLVKKVKNLAQSFGFTAGDALAFALAVLGHKGLHVDVRWAPPESTDDKDSWETAGLKIDAGVPVAQVLQEQGYTRAQVDGWLDTSDDQDLTRRVELLDKIGDAVQKLGAGVGFGVVTTEQVAQVIQSVLAPEEG